MKAFVLFYACLALCQAQNVVPTFDMDQQLSPNDLQRLQDLIDKERKLHQDQESAIKSVHIVALLNDYLDKFLGNIQKLIVNHHMDPTTLPDVLNVNIGLGHTNLTEGQLNDTSSIQRYQNATLQYDSDSGKFVAEMVLRFEDLKFLFKYHTKVTFISITGHLHGEIDHIHIHVKLGFDFVDSLVFVDSIDFKHTGDIKIWVSGNAAIDWITNAMSAVFTGILHNLILDIVKGIVADPINAVVDAINALLHPSKFF